MKIKATDLSEELADTIGLARDCFVRATSALKEREVEKCMIAGASLLSKIEIPDEPSSACIDLDNLILPLTKQDKQTIASVIVAYLLKAQVCFKNNNKNGLAHFLIKAKETYNSMYIVIKES